jgi:glycosyltransferase involved in cell wall biosynthesis
MSPVVSVIIPAYNSAPTIGRCVAALCAQQTRHRFEVLVVHSGTDDTCARATAAYGAVRTIQLAERATPPRARHVGVQHARGDILAFIDSDIYVYDDWIEQVVASMDQGYDLACGSIENGNPTSAVARAEQLLMFNEFMPDQPARPSWFALSGNTVLTRAAYAAFGPFADVRAAEDVVFSRRLIGRGGRILFHPSLRARHDNRTRWRPFLRNQVMVGRHTAVARRLVPFADSPRYALFLLALPVAPLVKLAKIAVHLGRDNPARAAVIVRELPVLSIGVLAYALGLVQGAFSSSTERSVGAGSAAANSAGPMSGAAPLQGK